MRLSCLIILERVFMEWMTFYGILVMAGWLDIF